MSPVAIQPRALPFFPQKALKSLLVLAFEEDEGNGDVTSVATLPDSMVSQAVLLAKEGGVMAGLPVVGEVFRHRGLAPHLELKVQEGDRFVAGQKLAFLHGKTRDLLLCERILLNFLQRMCGVATTTARYVEALAGSRTQVLDTRKTPPGYRELDKYAVFVGGGTNHRRGLYDQILIKDNHAAACGGVREAVRRARARFGTTYLVECEVRTLDEIETLVGEAVDILLLDNMDDDTLNSAIALSRAKSPKVKLEASGNMNLERVSRLRDFGLDFISVGGLTHSVKALDISLDVEIAGAAST
jgi:nicotinate-nucleotide pyrophosphorylase (carboxylating)